MSSPAGVRHRLWQFGI